LSLALPHKDRVHPPIPQIPPIFKTEAGLFYDRLFEIGVIGVICG